MTAAGATLGGTRRSAAREFGASIVTIMVKELRSRMRGRRAFIVLTVYLAILALITYGIYVILAPNATNMGIGMGGFGQANASALIGQSIFTLLSIFQMILVCFIAPAFTAGQISLEREKQTLDLLVSTPMRPSAIVIGKLVAALAFVFLMIVSAAPITAIVLMYGGASVDDIVRQQLVLFAAALLLGAVGLFFSALLKRTQAATVLTYITMLALTLGTAMLFIFWTALIQPRDGDFGIGAPRRAPEQLMYLSPAVGMLDVVANTEPGGIGFISGMLRELRGESSNVGGAIECIGPDCAVDQFGNAIGQDLEIGSSGYWWPRVSITFVLLAIVLTLASMRLVVPAGMRWAFRRPRRNERRAASPAVEAARGEGSPAIDDMNEERDR